MDNNELLKELFFIWQDRTEYKEPNKYFKKLQEFMTENFNETQKDILEDLIVRDTFENMLDAFIGGFNICRDLFYNAPFN